MKDAVRTATLSRRVNGRQDKMPAGPFASSVGVGRAEPEWAALNKVTAVCGSGEGRSPVSGAPLSANVSRGAKVCVEEVCTGIRLGSIGLRSIALLPFRAFVRLAHFVVLRSTFLPGRSVRGRVRARLTQRDRGVHG